MEILIVTRGKSCYRKENDDIPCLKREVDREVDRFEEIGKPLISREDKGLCMLDAKGETSCSYECLYTFPYPY